MCDNEPDVSKAVRRIARKQHICVECRLPILPGSIYEDYRGCWDGKWDKFKTCQLCLDLRVKVEKHSEEKCWEFGAMREYARDME